MKKLLFGTSYFKEYNPVRYSMWWNYYHHLFPEYDFLLVNDGPIDYSDIDIININCITKINPKNLIEFPEKKERKFEGWYRSYIKVIKELGLNYDKVVHIETDLLVISQRLIEYIQNTNTGFISMYSEKYRFPESALQILNKDSFELAMSTSDNYSGGIIEQNLKYTPNRSFIGDRYSEYLPHPDFEIDYYAQYDWNLDIKMLKAVKGI